MLFNVEYDNGRSIGGWLVPDRPDAVPRVRVFFEEGQSASVVVTATVPRDDIKRYGIHATGQCGFVIDETTIANIETAHGLCVADFDTGLIIYRRAPSSASFIEGRHFRLETSLISRNRVDAALQPYFHMNYAGLEQYSAQTAGALLGISYTLSLNASGRIPLPAIDNILRQHKFKVSALIGDPFCEILARVLIIQKGGNEQRRLEGLAPDKVLMRIHSALQDVPGRDLQALDRAIQSLDPEAMHYLSDPLTRLLSDCQPGQAPHRQAAQEALLRLSKVDVIGIESDPGEYFELLGAVLGRPIRLNVAMGKGPDPALSEQLRELPAFRRLTRFDGPLYDALLESVASLPDTDDADDVPPPLLTFGSDRLTAATEPGISRRAK